MSWGHNKYIIYSLTTTFLMILGGDILGPFSFLLCSKLDTPLIIDVFQLEDLVSSSRDFQMLRTFSGSTEKAEPLVLNNSMM